jgi:NiFe hydrogenase small subunit HydA
MRPKLRLLWLQGITCNGNTHSFLNYPHLNGLLRAYDVLYHPLLPSSHSLEAIAACSEQCDVLIVEGAYRADFERGGTTMQRLIAHYAESASHVIAAGSCASFGGMFKATDPERVSGLAYDRELPGGPLSPSEVINIPGCPLHPQWLAYVLEMIAGERPIALDALGRPKELFGYLVHHGCLRNEYFEWKVDAKSFGLKEGCLFYEQGCRGPMSHGPCNHILWNDVSSKTRSGQPCFGCTEPDFPRQRLFETKTNMSIPEEVPLGVPKRAYLTLTGIAKTFKIARLSERLTDDG